jgi:LacI family transcriptional regulator
VPQDLAVVGTGNLPLICDQGQVPITSVAFPLQEAAYLAASILDQMLAGAAVESQEKPLAPLGIVARQSTNSVAAQRQIVKRALAIMEARLADAGTDAQLIARETGVSLRLLYAEFARDLHSSPATVLMRMRLRRARQLLGTTDEKISVVAENCGFANLRTFQRAFSRLEGVSPRLWRGACANTPELSGPNVQVTKW